MSPIESTRRPGLSFARRVYFPRSVGLGIGFVAVAFSFAPLQPAWWGWALLVFNGFVWPHLAYQLARRSEDAYAAERRSLMIDSLGGGLWAAGMHFNPLPSVLILAMMSMDNVAAGGPRLLLRGFAAQLGGIVLGLLLFGFGPLPQTTALQLYACLPMLIFYPLTLGLVCYRLALRLSEHKEALRQVSRTDALTGLQAPGYWRELVNREFARCRRWRQSGSLLLVDIDHFKAINDTHGHLAGDAVLRQLGELLRDELREVDMAGRYGGDEFGVLLPAIEPARALQVAERLRERVALEDWREIARPLTLSIGVAPFDARLATPAAWIKAADQALYRAKQQGRNRVVSSDTAAAVALA